MFMGLNEYQFAILFVSVNRAEITKDLQIKYLDEEATIKTIATFIEQNKDNILKKFKKQSDWLYDAKFYTELIKFLQNEKNLEMTADQYINYLKAKLYKHTFVE